MDATRVILFELTCGAEEGIPAAVRRKKRRYNKELTPSITAAGWECAFMTM